MRCVRTIASVPSNRVQSCGQIATLLGTSGHYCDANKSFAKQRLGLTQTAVEGTQQDTSQQDAHSETFCINLKLLRVIVR
jgi:hypothetical protein